MMEDDIGLQMVQNLVSVFGVLFRINCTKKNEEMSLINFKFIIVDK